MSTKKALPLWKCLFCGFGLSFFRVCFLVTIAHRAGGQKPVSLHRAQLHTGKSSASVKPASNNACARSNSRASCSSSMSLTFSGSYSSAFACSISNRFNAFSASRYAGKLRARSFAFSAFASAALCRAEYHRSRFRSSRLPLPRTAADSPQAFSGFSASGSRHTLPQSFFRNAPSPTTTHAAFVTAFSIAGTSLSACQSRFPRKSAASLAFGCTCGTL